MVGKLVGDDDGLKLGRDVGLEDGMLEGRDVGVSLGNRPQYHIDNATIKWIFPIIKT